MFKAYTFPLNPSTEQHEQIKSHGGAARWIWNQMLAQNIEKYNNEKKFNFRFDMNKITTQLRGEIGWLAEINSQVLQAKNMDLHEAIKSKIARKSKQTGFPKFKRKSDNSDSFRVPQFFKLSNKAVKLPKIGWVKWKQNRKLEGKAKNITIKQVGDKWMAVVLCELPDVPTRNAFAESEVIGIDVGIKDFAVLSDGIKYANPKHLQKREKLLKSRQRSLSNKVKGSANRTKARKCLSNLHRHVANQRKDFQWKLVDLITKNYQVVAMEDLNIRGMGKNRKLSKSISSAGWGLFKMKLTHKLAETGGLLFEIDRFSPSSKTCSSCGTINTMLTLKDREWDCSCGLKHDRDVNAAINIRNFCLNRLGTSQIHYGCGDTSNGEDSALSSSYESTKQQNLGIGLEATEALDSW